MNKAAIKAFATGARKTLMISVAQKVVELTAQKDNKCPKLSEDIEEKGINSVVEEVSYTWFKRIVGVRYMEVNGFLPNGIRVLSSKIQGKTVPDILDKIPVDEHTDKLYTELFIDCCSSLEKILPDYFGSSLTYLKPLLKLSYKDEKGVARSIVDRIPEEDFKDGVEIVGWLYQYYNDARKNEVINLYGGRVKNEDVPAATQFFTTDWIVRYMVDNSLGKYWLERNPQSFLKEKLKFYLNNDDETVNENISPEDIKVLDPCMGSGHILVYAFDVLMEIYKECGYSEYDAAKLIIKKNIYGLDIDRRSYELAYFALLMKAGSYNKDIFYSFGHLNIYSIGDFENIGENVLSFVAGKDKKMKSDLQEVVSSLHDAGSFGSVVKIKDIDFDRVFERIAELNNSQCEDLFTIAYHKDMNEMLVPLLRQAKVMADKYTVVATNPPYLNRMDKKLKNYVNKHYKDYSGDLFSVFIYRNFDFCIENGYSAFMSPFVWMFIKTYEKLREYIIKNKSISSLVQLEYSAFEEATVPICTFVLKNGQESKPGVYIRLSDFKGGMEVQKQKVLDAVNNPKCTYLFETPSEFFSSIPGSPIAYWAHGETAKIFKGSPSLSEKATVTNGLFTCDNKRFLRFWYEVPKNEIFFDCSDKTECLASSKIWYPYNKGGDFRKWYGNHEYVVNFKDFGYEISEYRVKSGQSASFPGQNYYFKPSISWSFVSSSKFGVRYYPKGFVFDIAGSSVFVKNEKDMLYTLGFLSSNSAFEMLNLINPTLNYQAGNIAKLPLRIEEKQRDKIEKLVLENISISQNDWDSFETSWNFKIHPLIRFKPSNNCKISEAFESWDYFTKHQFNALKKNEEEINKTFIDIYGLKDGISPNVEDRDIMVHKANVSTDIRSLLSFSVGCMFGRYNVHGFNFKNREDIIPITPCLKNNIAENFVEFIKAVFGQDYLEENLNYIAKALTGSGTAREVIQNYFLNRFYRDHVKTYKKRPIYWMLDGGEFKAFLYIHSYNADTLSKASNYSAQVKPTIEEQMLNEDIPIKQKEKILKKLEKLNIYEDRLKKAAKKHITIDLNDGVLENYKKIQNGNELFPKLK